MSDAETLLQNALAAHRAGQLDLAGQQYRQVLSAAPGRADVWNLLGMVSRQQGQHAAAIEQLTRAIELDPALPTRSIIGGDAPRSKPGKARGPRAAGGPRTK